MSEPPALPEISSSVSRSETAQVLETPVITHPNNASSCFKTIMEFVVDTGLGDAPDARQQRNVARFFEAITAVLPAEVRSRYIEYGKQNPIMHFVGNRNHCRTWLEPILTQWDNAADAAIITPIPVPVPVPIPLVPRIPSVYVPVSSIPAPPAVSSSAIRETVPPSFPLLRGPSRSQFLAARLQRQSEALPPLSETPPRPRNIVETFATLPQDDQRFIPLSNAKGTSGTPASYRIGWSRKHSKALSRLEQSAQRFAGRVTVG